MGVVRAPRPGCWLNGLRSVIKSESGDNNEVINE